MASSTQHINPKRRLSVAAVLLSSSLAATSLVCGEAVILRLSALCELSLEELLSIRVLLKTWQNERHWQRIRFSPALRFTCQFNTLTGGHHETRTTLSVTPLRLPRPFSRRSPRSRHPRFAAGEDKLSDLALEDLLRVTVSSVTRFEQPTTEAPASVTVIDNDELRAARLS